jgi:4-hydroxy-tetrahydrodipicolinate synthase
MDLAGTVVPMATPVASNGREVDEDTLADFTRSLVEGGVHGLFPGSSIGEFPSLTAEQTRTVVRTVVDAADGDAPVIAGCCDTNVADVRELVGTAADAGADAAVVVTPYYLDTTQRGLVQFFERVADDSPLPLLLYNIPALTGNELAVETVATLADHDAVVGLKDTSGDLVYQHDVIGATPPSFAVLSGETASGAASLDLGADGLIAGPANVFPAELAELYEAHARGDDATVTQLVREVVLPLVSAYQDLPTATAIKRLVKRDRLDLGDPLPPLAPLSADERERLDARYATVAETLEAEPPQR